MSDRINLLSRVSDLHKSPQFSAYSKVVIHVNDESDIVAGDDVGRTLEFTNPFGTQEMANNLLASLVGFQYQPFIATGALLDPAAEIGDGISVGSVYGGMYTRERDFSRLMKANISAPHDEEINHEYKFEAPAERKFKREIGDVKATILLQADQIQLAVQKADEALSEITQTSTDIDAKVTADMSGNKKTFGWKLTATAWELYSNNKTVLKANKDGIEVNGSGTFSGTVTATGGKVGGFTIGSKAIYNNISEYGGTQTKGVYLGTDGIQLGQNFRVNTSGTVSAKNMVLSGTLTVGGETITAAKLRQGAERANNGYQNWNGTTNTVNSNGDTWSTGAGFGYNYNLATQANTGTYPAQFTCGRLLATYFSLSGNDVGARTITYKDGNGNTRTATFLMVQ